MTMAPEIRINNAMRLRGMVDLAGIRQKYNHRDFQTNGPMDRWYQDRVSQNAFDTAMIPSINKWWFTAQMPWGVMVVGARDFAWGTGILAGENTRNDSLLFVLPYGPFRFIPQIWLANNPDGFSAFTPYHQVVQQSVFSAPSPTSPSSYPNCDGGLHYPLWWAFNMTYDSGPVTLGWGYIGRFLHSNQANLGANGLAGIYPAYFNGPFNSPTIYQYGGLDQVTQVWTTFLKYNNGRFFGNFEYNWATQDNYHTGTGQTLSFPGAQYSGAPPIYIEAAQAFAEFGALCGPAKLAFLFAWSSGASLNNGNPTKIYTGIAINSQTTDPYNYLMFHTYGGGNDAPWSGLTFTKEENGQISDAWALAARLDYAVAANLNIWGSYMWANRVEKNGWLAGQKDYNGNPAVGTTFFPYAWGAQDAVNWKLSAMPGSGGNMNPYVDDCYLGWEGQLGVDWKLLENMTVCSRYAYWQPGPWFDQAYQVVGLNKSGGVAPSGALPYAPLGGFMQGRSAIQAFSSSILIDF